MSYRGRNRRGGYNNGGMQYDSNPSNGGALQGHQLTQAANQHQRANAIVIEVRDWQGGSKEDCVAFLSRKSRVALQNSTIEGDVLVGTVRSQSDAESLVKWSGARFAGRSLKITSRSSPGTSNTIEMLKGFLQRRYNPQIKMLDLSSIAQDPQLQQQGIITNVSTQSKMFAALMKIASQLNLQVESVNLSDNNLDDLTGVSPLAQTFPKLLNLALQNNRISKLRALETWKNKFRCLRELVMGGNPITMDPQYKNEVAKTFPRLVVLDGIVIRDENKLKAIYELPVQHKQFFFEDAEIQQVSTQFVANFLQCWDNDRTQLLPLYTPDSQFSLSMDSSVPNDASASDVSFGFYIPVSRNLSRVSSERSRKERLGHGPEQIAKLFQQLPKTKHKLDTDPSAYSMEAWRYPQVNGITISLHGEFQETGTPQLDTTNNNNRGHRRNNLAGSASSKLTPKSFDRVFVIIPTPNGIIIASDLLIVRPIASHSAWDETPTTAAAPVTTTNASPSASASPAPQLQSQPSAPGVLSPHTPQIPFPDTLTPIQKEIATKIMMETKLNMQFTLLLAEQAGWNFENAIGGFQQSHQQGQIPPEAFQ